MKKKYTYLFLLLALLSVAFIVQETPEKITIKTKTDHFTIDNIGNIYSVNGDELIKFLPSGKFFSRYSNLKLGNIITIDATNPLKVLLYYKDFQQIVFLDNQLTDNSEAISLEDLGHEQTELVCASTNNSFWIYDKQNNELMRFNENSKKIASTGNLKQILQVNINPDFMREYNGYLYLNCQDNGIYVFDMFGAFSKIISLKKLKQFQVNEDVIYFKRDSSICSYKYKLFEEACKVISGSKNVIDIQYLKGKLYKSYKDSIVITQLQYD